MPHTEYPEIAAAVAYQYNPEKNVGRRLWIATVVIPRLNALDRMVEGGLNGVGSRSLIINQNGKDILSVDSLKWGLEVEVPFFVPKEQIVGFEPYEGTPPEFRWAQ